jgi:hypothetical protein
MIFYLGIFRGAQMSGFRFVAVCFLCFVVIGLPYRAKSEALPSKTVIDCSKKYDGAIPPSDDEGPRFYRKCLGEAGAFAPVTACKSAECKYTAICSAFIASSAICKCEWGFITDGLSPEEQLVLVGISEAIAVQGDSDRAKLIGSRLGMGGFMFQSKLELLKKMTKDRCDGGSGLLQ